MLIHLLVISNDKLRHQFGNLKMKEAFEKADNVLATAAKCITDVINSTGQINVDFADVCTVMRNGGVAILGSAAAGGENRAQRAIEEALNSPLLNDNDIRGAKWILININSSEGEHEFTMDEVEIIQNYLLSQAGEDTDVILGMGYDNHLEDKIGITLIATGFEHKDPFMKRPAKEVPRKDEKIVMTLDMRKDEPAPVKLHIGAEKELEEEKAIAEIIEQPAIPIQQDIVMPLREELQPRLVENEPQMNSPIVFFTNHPASEKSTGSNGPVNKQVDKIDEEVRTEWILSLPSDKEEKKKEIESSNKKTVKPENNSPSSAASGGYLAKPSNIYAEPELDQSFPEHLPVKEPILSTNANPIKEEEPSPDMQLVFKDEIPAADEPRAYPTLPIAGGELSAEEPALQDEVELQKQRAAERIQKLRNLSFNINAADPNNEFETVPAYIRRNLELYNTVSNVENFYSNYEVKKEDDNTTRISTINTFLDGKKPD